MRGIAAALLLTAAGALAAPAWAGPRGLVRSFDFANGSGTVDYDAGYVEATAIGTVDMKKMVNTVQAETVARRTARHLAYEVLAETVGRIQIDAKTLYQDAIATMDALKTETHAVIRGAVPVSDTLEWTRDRRTQEEIPVAKVTLRLALTDQEGLEHLLDRHMPPGGGYQPSPAPMPRPAAPPVVQPAALTVPTPPSTAPATPPATPPVSIPPPPAAAPGRPAPSAAVAQAAPPAAPAAPEAAPPSVPRYGALVLDTRQIAPGYQPALRLYVKDEQGNIVFGPATVRPSIEREGKRALRYASSVEEARGFFPESGEPLVVKPASVAAPGEVVLRQADARAILQADLAEAFLREARVAVVLE